MSNKSYIPIFTIVSILFLYMVISYIKSLTDYQLVETGFGTLIVVIVACLIGYSNPLREPQPYSHNLVDIMAGNA